MAGRWRKVLADTRPLQVPEYRRLWVANIITVIGAQLTVVAVPAQIYSMTGSSGMVGLTGLFGLVPLIVFGLWGGALADVVDRKRLLEFTTSGLIATSFLFYLQAAREWTNVWILLSIFSLQQAFFAVNQPTRTAILPKLVDRELLPSANALNMTVMSAGAIAGPLVGGALIPVLGFEWLYLVDTITLFATLYAVWRLPSLPVEGAVKKAPGLRSVIVGLGYLWIHRLLLMSFVVDLIAMICGMPRALFPEVAVTHFGGPADGGMEFALLYAAMPAGSVLGGLFSGWIARVSRYGRAVMLAITAWGLAIIVFGVAVELAPHAQTFMLGVGLAALVVGGAADMISASFRQAILLEEADDALRGRLQGIFIVVVVGGPRLADVAHGYASDAIGPSWAIIGGGLAVLAGILACALAYPRFWRHVSPSSSGIGL